MKLVYLPLLFVERLIAVGEMALDGIRYARYGGPSDGLSEAIGSRKKKALQTQITKDYHRVEKGLSLSQPRSTFGERVSGRLQRDLAKLRQIDQNDKLLEIGESRLQELSHWNSHQDRSSGGALLKPPATVPRLDKDTIRFVFCERRSVRTFKPYPVPRELVDEALTMAQRSPSVCNRQTWRVRIYDDSGDIRRVLRHQNGNTGIGPTVPLLFLITTDIELFTGPGERFQRWIEGGIFSMALALSLHSLGIANCMLNWSRSNRSSHALRKLCLISPSEEIIMMIAAGLPEADYFTATSPRKDLQQLRTWSVLDNETGLADRPAT